MVFFSFLSRFGGSRVVSLTYPRADRGRKTGGFWFGQDGFGRSLAAQEGARPESRREKSAALLQLRGPRRRGQKGRTAGDVEHDPVLCQCPYAIDARRLHLTMPGVVASSISSRFGPRRGRRRGAAERARSLRWRLRGRAAAMASARRHAAATPSTRSHESLRAIDGTRHHNNAGPSCAARR